LPSPSGVLTALHDKLDAAVRRLGFRLAVFAALSIIITWPLLSTAPAMNFFRDAQVLMSYEDAAVRSVMHFVQLPLWDPYYCGGVYALGTPQSRFVSPTFLLSLLLGPLRAEPVTIFFMLIIGLEGAYRYSASRGGSALGSFLAAPVFAASGVFAAAPPLGWINFFGFELVAWALVGVRRAVRGDPRGIVLGAGALAWIVGFGGTYAAPMSALLCVVEVLEGVVDQLLRKRPVSAALLGGVACASLALGMSSIRLWPIAETLSDAPRVIADTPGMTWQQVGEALFGHSVPFGAGTRWEHGAFMVGALALPAAILGLTRLRSIPLALVAGASAWLATGYAYPHGPFPALRRIPVFSVLRYPERYLIFVALALCVLAAIGIERVESLAKRRPLWHLLGWALGAALCFNAAFQVQHHYRLSEPRDLLPAPESVSRPFQQARGNRWALGFYAPMSRGSLSCWDAYPIPQSPLLRSDLEQEEYLVDPSAGAVERVRWSPNRIDLRVSLKRPARLRVNQNWHAGWRASAGSVVSDDGLLAVDLPPGQHDLTLRFIPRSAVGGALGTLAAVVVAIWLWRRGRAHASSWKGRASIAVACMVPLALAGLVRVAWPQPPAPPRILRAPSGDPILADDLPPEATRLNVRYANNVTLVGATVSPSELRAGMAATITLYWKVTGEVPRGVVVFTHVQPEHGAFINRDHDTLSSTLDFADAPRDTLLRDVMAVTIPARGRWVVWTGLWMPKHDGSRVPIAWAGDAKVVDGRVAAAEISAQ
jgi:hypothetical protein